MQTRADATPPDAIAAFVVGSILHHLGKWQEADTYLKRSETLMKDEPRQYLYQAMDAFHLGRQADAERLVAQAASLGSSDPDVLYCRAMIFSEGKIDQAIADLQAYDKLMSTTLDKTPGKQQHVEEILAELQACRGAKDPQQCRQLRRASRVVVAWLPGLTVVALALFALVRWRRRK
jgi:tetratricopeptide (TPR) repeat protein